MVSASRFIGDPIDLPLGKPIYQLPLALVGLGELPLAAYRIGIYIKGRF
jgi:hypothetical protein